jgi:hypothetical protein
VGVFLVTAMAATVAVVAGALIVIIGRPQSFSDPLGSAIAQLSSGKAGASLVQERQQVILEDAATQSFSVTSAPKLSKPAPPSSSGTSAPPAEPPPNPSSAQGIAYNMLASFGFSTSQWSCLDALWNRESGWRYNAENPSGAYGIPQALPGSKMATAGADWATNPATQIKWGLGYIQSRYGTPCNAWNYELANGYY